MYKYVAFVLGEESSEKIRTVNVIVRHLLDESPGQWDRAINDNGLLVYHSGHSERGARAHALSNGQGVVLGKLFRSLSVDGRQTSDVNFNDRLSRKVVDSGGRHLISEYWGSYVALVFDNARNRHFVLRDPSASLACYYLNYRGVDIYFSWVPDLADCKPLSMTVNWRFIAAYLYHSKLRIRETGINEVRELLAGECLQRSKNNRQSEFYWDPRSFSPSPCHENSREAVNALAEVTKSCVKAWASCYRHIILELSGGLDSAIVLSCLNPMSNESGITCMNLHTGHSDADERHFARLAAERAGLELHELTMCVTETDAQRLMSPQKFASPSPYTFASTYDDLFIELAKKTGADAIFSGQGGDHLFHQSGSPLMAADYLFHHGLNTRFFREAYSAAFLSRISFWQVLWEVVRVGVFGQVPPTYGYLRERPNFLTIDAQASLPGDYIYHPWLRSLEHSAPAKFRQVAALVDFQSYYWTSRRAQYADVVYALFSQPLMELCLQIPTYTLTVGGRDRGLARRAFAGDLPKEIISRRSKGAINSYLISLLSRNAGFIREILLEGELVSAGVVDKARLEKWLRLSKIERGDNMTQLMEYVSTEIWARNWLASQVRAVA